MGKGDLRKLCEPSVPQTVTKITVGDLVGRGRQTVKSEL